MHFEDALAAPVRAAGSEGGKVREHAERAGGSSALPHKRNPVAAISVRAAGLVSTLFPAMPHEHQRAAGAWHAERRPRRELLAAAGSTVWWLRASY